MNSITLIELKSDAYLGEAAIIRNYYAFARYEENTSSPLCALRSRLSPPDIMLGELQIATKHVNRLPPARAHNGRGIKACAEQVLSRAHAQ